MVRGGSHVGTLVVVGVLVVVVAACSGGATSDQGPPEGWTGQAERWWRVGVDTNRTFRDLETLASMGVTDAEADAVMAADRRSAQGEVLVRQWSRTVRQDLVRLFRNHPEVVDSLFEQHVVPDIAEADVTGPRAETAEALKQAAYRTLRSHFQEPQTALQLGDDIPVPYPDSLRRRGVEGRVRMQVYVDEEGEPTAIELIEGVHPVLDAIAMRAATQMRWRPAYLMRSGRWASIPAWTRFSVRFRAG